MNRKKQRKRNPPSGSESDLSGTDEICRDRSRSSTIDTDLERSGYLSSTSHASTISKRSTTSKTSAVSAVSNLSAAFTTVKNKITSAIKPGKASEEIIKQKDREINELKEEIAKLKKHLENEAICKEILDSVSKIVSLYRGKLCKDFGQMNINYFVKNAKNVQIGDHNLIQEDDVSKLNVLLFNYHSNLGKTSASLDKVKMDIENTRKNLENTKRTLADKLQELQQTKYELDTTSERLMSTTSELEGTSTRLDEQTRLLQELVEGLKDMKENDNDQTLKLKYTICLTESPLMANCVKELKRLDKQDRKYYFVDVPDRAKFGVMRILRKYCQKDPKLTNAEFAQMLEIDAYDIEEDSILNEDNCTWILTEWVHTSPENDNDALCEKLPKLKQYGSVHGTHGSMPYEASVSRLSFAGIEEQRTELFQEMRSISTSVQVLKTGQIELAQDLKGTISLAHQSSVNEIKKFVSSSTTKDTSDIELPTS